MYPSLPTASRAVQMSDLLPTSRHDILMTRTAGRLTRDPYPRQVRGFSDNT
jgi:hypothetical protein